MTDEWEGPEYWLEKEISELRSLLHALVTGKHAGMVPYDSMDEWHCAYCRGELHIGDDDHEEDCPIQEARKYLNG